MREINSKCKDVLNQANQIYHLAAYNGTKNFYEVPYSVILNSSLSTINIVNFILVNKVNAKILYTGSSESYAEGVNRGFVDIPTNEKSFLSLGDHNNPRWSYACAKTYGEYLLFSANLQYDLEFLVARVHNIYGPRMGYNHFFTDFLSRIKENNFELYGGNQTRSFCNIFDCCRALVMLMNSNKSREIYNVGSSQEIKIYDCAKKIMDISNIKGKIVNLPSPDGSVLRRCPEISKLRSLIGVSWEKVSLEDGLKDLIKWYEKGIDQIK